MNKTCNGPQCDDPAFLKGLCRTHYNQQWKGKPLTVKKPYRKRPVCPEGYAFCNGCEEVKRVSEFYQRNGKPVHKCKPCWIAISAACIERRKRQAV